MSTPTSARATDRVFGDRAVWSSQVGVVELVWLEDVLNEKGEVIYDDDGRPRGKPSSFDVELVSGKHVWNLPWNHLRTNGANHIDVGSIVWVDMSRAELIESSEEEYSDDSLEDDTQTEPDDTHLPNMFIQ